MGKKHKFDYFSAFEDLSELAVKEADLLIETIETFTSADQLKGVMEKAHEIEHQGDLINHDIFQSGATDFSTPIECEDIIQFAQNLDDVIDYGRHLLPLVRGELAHRKATGERGAVVAQEPLPDRAPADAVTS